MNYESLGIHSYFHTIHLWYIYIHGNVSFIISETQNRSFGSSMTPSHSVSVEPWIPIEIGRWIGGFLKPPAPYLHKQDFEVTLPETNSSPLKMDGWNTSFLLGWPMFRGYVSFRQGILPDFESRKTQFSPPQKTSKVGKKKHMFCNPKIPAFLRLYGGIPNWTTVIESLWIKINVPRV